jgi:NADH dehydrogenase
MDKKSIVVLGAGFGGLRAAIDIAKGLQHLKFAGKYEVVLVDRNDCHLFIPFLYRVAAGMDQHFETKCTYDIATLIKNLPIRFVKAEVASLDLMNGDVHLKTGEELQTNYLVIALGSETNFFDILGMAENALQLKTLESAMEIREAITRAFAKGGEVKIVAGGAGPNGIELAAEIRTWANHAEKENPDLHVSVSIVEALPEILNGLDVRSKKIAARRLEKLGIPVMLNAKITGVSENKIAIAEAASIPFDVFIWTGGVKTPALLTQLPIVKDQRDRPLAKSDMACVPGTPDLKLAPMIYGIGDSVCFMNPKTGKPIPAIAHVAILEGRIAARNLIEEIKHAEFPSHSPAIESYMPTDYPYVIPIGEGWAVAKFGWFVFSGALGWTFGRLIELNYLSMIMPPFQAWKAWRRT